MKRVLLVLLCVVMCLPLFVACGPDDEPAEESSNATTTGSAVQNTQPVTTGGNETGDPDDPETETTAPDFGFDDVAKNDWGGYQFRILCSKEYDLFPDFSCEKTVTGNVVNDQIFARNEMVEEALNIEIYVEKDSNWAGILDAQYSAGWAEGDYNYFSNNGRTALTYASQGTLADLGTYDEINLFRAYWDQAFLDTFLMDDSIYALLGEISLIDQIEIDVFLFNKAEFKKNGLEEPYDLVRTHEWTVDRLLDYMAGFAKDYDGNGYQAEKDRYSIVGNNYLSANSIFYGSGFSFCTNDGEAITFDFDKDDCDSLVDVVLSVWGKNGTCMVARASDGDATPEKVYEIFSDDRALFTTIVLTLLPQYFSEMESDYGILPAPLHEDGQEKYYTYVNRGVPMSLVPATDPNPERTGNIIEALCAASHDVVIPKVFEIVTKIQNTRDGDSAEMLEIARVNKTYDAAHWLNIVGFDQFAMVMITERQNITSSYLNMYLKMAEKSLASFVKSYQNLKK